MARSRLRSARALAALAALGAAGLGCRGDGPSWKLTWSDEFDGAAGQPPSAAIWSADVGTGWGNAQLEYDTARTENAALDGDGHLVITARKEPYEGSAYTSARLLTKGKVEQKYGRIEARIKLPVGQGMWPAFWLLGRNIDEVGWPTCGEIDVMEYRGQNPSVALGTIHGPGYSGGAAISDAYVLEGAGFDQDFHVFAVEWHDGRIVWEVDGKVYHSASKSSLPAGAPWVFDQPFFILLNLAVGGTFVGSPDASTVFPQSMIVDYVRIYERD